MNKTIVAAVAIVAVAVVAAFYTWSSHNRHSVVTSSKGIVYEVDRKTGQWALIGNRKIPQESTKKKNYSEEPLPFDEQAKVTGNAGLSCGSFSGKIYNGSTWTITKIIINVTVKEQDGSILWSRDFSEVLKVEPLQARRFSVTVTGDHGVKDAPWTIKQVFGYKR